MDELYSHQLSVQLSTRMRNSRAFDLRDMSFSRKLFGKLQRSRTLPKDFDHCSGLLLWLCGVWFVFFIEASGILHVVEIKYSSRIPFTSYEPIKQNNTVKS